jgi:hypothetical protein
MSTIFKCLGFMALVRMSLIVSALLAAVASQKSLLLSRNMFRYGWAITNTRSRKQTRLAFIFCFAALDVHTTCCGLWSSVSLIYLVQLFHVCNQIGLNWLFFTKNSPFDNEAEKNSHN